MKKLLIGLSILFSSFQANANLFGNWRIPGITTPPVDTHAIACAAIRADANSKIQAYKESILSAQVEIRSLDIIIPKTELQLLRDRDDLASALNQMKVFSAFQSVAQDFTAESAQVKRGLQELRSRSDNQTLLETLDVMARQTKNASSARLATVIKEVMNRSDSQLQEILEGVNSEAFINQLIQLIGISQSFVQDIKTSIEKDLQDDTATLQAAVARKTELNEQIKVASEKIPQEAERTSCNF